MSVKWTKQHIDQLLRDGKIRGAKEISTNKEPCTGGRKVAKHFKKGDKAKDWMAWNLLFWCQERGHVLEEEYKFHAERKFRFDWAIPGIMVAVEYEGLMSDKSGHTTITGYTKDTEKYNLAQSGGWKVLRFTALNYNDLITELNKHV